MLSDLYKGFKCKKFEKKSEGKGCQMSKKLYHLTWNYPFKKCEQNHIAPDTYINKNDTNVPSKI